jgi:hypothetical protein
MATGFLDPSKLWACQGGPTAPADPHIAPSMVVSGTNDDQFRGVWAVRGSGGGQGWMMVD